jgi:hypothetical protein
MYAHRAAYLLRNGRLPVAPLELDHICRNRRCVNPDHLREVTRKGNMANGAHRLAARCVNGHEWNEANTYIRMDTNTRQCRACAKARKDAAQNREA